MTMIDTLTVNEPLLVIDKEKCVENLRMMIKKAEQCKVKLRPHFKTHQSVEIAEWYKAEGIQSITVSSIKMAEDFAKHGWKDMTIALPFFAGNINRLNELCEKADINIIVDSLDGLLTFADRIVHPVGLFIEISTGYNRTGIRSNKHQDIEQLVHEVGKYKSIKFKGFLSHAGHTYDAKNRNEIHRIHFEEKIEMLTLKRRFKHLYPDIKVSIGDTPSCSISSNFDGIDEIRPGNFIFYDIFQESIGSCNIDQIGIKLLCPVISKNHQANEIVIHGGAVHLSKDHLMNIDGKPLFGRIISNKSKEILNKKNYVCRLSQEHGIVRCSPKVFNEINIGDIIEVYPVHACLTMDIMRTFTIKGTKDKYRLNRK